MIKILLVAIFSIMSVVQQPKGNYLYVDNENVTQFGLSRNYGLLAHNNKDILGLKEGNEVSVILEDGTGIVYKVYHIDDYQRIRGNPYDTFINLKTLDIFLETEVFKMYYKSLPNSDLVLQTCIERNENDTWGVRFAVAIPIRRIEPK